MRQSLISAHEATAPIPVYAVSEAGLPNLLSKLGANATGWAERQGYNAQAGRSLMVPLDGGGQAVLFGTLPENLPHPFALGTLANDLPPADYELQEPFPAIAQALLGFALSSYAFNRYRGGASGKQPRLVVPEHVDIERLQIVLDGVQLARDLINIPANDLGTAELAAQVEDLFNAHGGSGSIVVGDELLKGNLPLVHAVGRASDNTPRLADFTWGDDDAPKVTLVGKGVIFDTGGLNIKPGGSMSLMKKDMGGAANVLGLASMIMAAKLPVRLRVIVPCVENSIAGSAFRPGDILPSRKGLTVEIGNTDAEGRLILADALALADEESPELLIDMATLTGAARVALGPDLPPYFTNDEDLAEDISIFAEASEDPMWRLPLWQPYMKYLDSQVADISHINTSGTGFAGSITAALFLSRFVENAESWAHFDIYGWTPSSKPGKVAGGEAQGIRALFDLISDQFSA
ncbi:leucyl aminopeptidase family protein [Roseibium sp.]|uniref:leucyl aminopeptidase family protein n=1 Tax=Roseibium sp. TaxID=1936156 RepID=UPI003A987065